MIFDYLKKIRNKGFVPENVLDIGANFGNFSLRCKQDIWTFGTNYHLIEANDECKFRLSMTGFPVYYEILGDEDGKIVTFYKTKDIVGGTGNSTYKEKTRHYDEGHVIEEKKKLITLDTLFKNSYMVFDFAKLDTQGSELDILRGGKETLSSCKYILIETSLKYYNDGVPLKQDIINFMEEFSYNKHEVVEQHIWGSSDPVGDIHKGDIFQEDLIFFK